MLFLTLYLSRLGSKLACGFTDLDYFVGNLQQNMIALSLYLHLVQFSGRQRRFFFYWFPCYLTSHFALNCPAFSAQIQCPILSHNMSYKCLSYIPTVAVCLPLCYDKCCLSWSKPHDQRRTSPQGSQVEGVAHDTDCEHRQ